MGLKNFSDNELRKELRERNPMEPWSQEYNLRGAAWGNAFTARMMSENPNLPMEARQAYEWAEEEFLHIAQDQISNEEAVIGYGG
jgi:hypothetical protein